MDMTMTMQCQRCHGAKRARSAQKLRYARPQVRGVQCHAAAAEKKKTEYTADLRKAAIALHTREQLGSRKASTGETKEDAKPSPPEPTLEGYLRFLQENKKVFGFYETTIAGSSDPQLVLFQDTGIERSAALEKDLLWFQNQQDMKLLPELPEGPGSTYVQYLTRLAEEDIPSFLCHYYNTYFAHMSGGAMIGKSVSSKLLDGFELEFYKYPAEGDPKQTLGAAVKEKLNAVAEGWHTEDRQRSIAETKQTFHYSGTILKCIFNL